MDQFFEAIENHVTTTILLCVFITIIIGLIKGKE